MAKSKRGGPRIPRPGKKLGRPFKKGQVKVLLTTRITPDLMARIEILSSAKGMSKSALVAELLDTATSVTQPEQPQDRSSDHR